MPNAEQQSPNRTEGQNQGFTSQRSKSNPSENLSDEDRKKAGLRPGEMDDGDEEGQVTGKDDQQRAENTSGKENMKGENKGGQPNQGVGGSTSGFKSR